MSIVHYLRFNGNNTENSNQIVIVPGCWNNIVILPRTGKDCWVVSTTESLIKQCSLCIIYKRFNENSKQVYICNPFKDIGVYSIFYGIPLGPSR